MTDWLQAISSIGAVIVSIFALLKANKNSGRLDTFETTVTAEQIGGATGQFYNCSAGKNSFGAVSIQNEGKSR